MPLYLLLISNFVWIIPAITHRRGRFRYYFMLVAFAALTGMINLSFDYFFKTDTRVIINYLYVLISLGLPFSLIDLNKFPTWKYWMLAVYIGGIAYCIIPHSKYSVAILFFIIQFLLSGLVISILYYDFIKSIQINFFIVIMMMYQFSVVINYYYGLSGTQMGLYNSLLMMKFEILIGLFFSIFTENSKHLIFKIKQ